MFIFLKEMIKNVEKLRIFQKTNIFPKKREVRNFYQNISLARQKCGQDNDTSIRCRGLLNFEIFKRA